MPEPPPLQLDKLILATDWPENHEQLHEQAASIAKLLGAEVVVVTVFDPPAPLRIKRGAPGIDEYRKELEEEAKETATEVTAELINQGLKARAVVAEGHPADAILQQAEDEEAGLIVIGGGGGGGRARDFLAGSTTERVVRHSKVPVLVVK